MPSGQGMGFAVAGSRAGSPGHRVGSRKYRVEVEERICKSCGICIAFCTRGVLEAQGALGKAVAAHSERCTGCRLCEIYCPDWAITVGSAAPETDAADAAAADAAAADTVAEARAESEVGTPRPGGGEGR